MAASGIEPTPDPGRWLRRRPVCLNRTQRWCRSRRSRSEFRGGRRLQESREPPSVSLFTGLRLRVAIGGRDLRLRILHRSDPTHARSTARGAKHSAENKGRWQSRFLDLRAELEGVRRNGGLQVSPAPSDPAAGLSQNGKVCHVPGTVVLANQSVGATSRVYWQVCY